MSSTISPYLEFFSSKYCHTTTFFATIFDVIASPQQPSVLPRARPFLLLLGFHWIPVRSSSSVKNRWYWPRCLTLINSEPSCIFFRQSLAAHTKSDEDTTTTTHEHVMQTCKRDRPQGGASGDTVHDNVCVAMWPPSSYPHWWFSWFCCATVCGHQEHDCTVSVDTSSWSLSTNRSWKPLCWQLTGYDPDVFRRLADERHALLETTTGCLAQDSSVRLVAVRIHFWAVVRACRGACKGRWRWRFTVLDIVWDLVLCRLGRRLWRAFSLSPLLRCTVHASTGLGPCQTLGWIVPALSRQAAWVGRDVRLACSRDPVNFHHIHTLSPRKRRLKCPRGDVCRSEVRLRLRTWTQQNIA